MEDSKFQRLFCFTFVFAVLIAVAGCERQPEPELETPERLERWEIESLVGKDGVQVVHGRGRASFVLELDKADHAVCVNAPGKTGGYGAWYNDLVQVTVRRGESEVLFTYYIPSFSMFTPTQVLAAGDVPPKIEVKVADYVAWLIRFEPIERHREQGGCPPLVAVAQPG